MIDGTYSLTLDTPLGVKTGELSLKAQHVALSGSLSAMGKRLALTGEVLASDGEGADVRIEGAISAMFQTVSYSCEAHIAASGAISGTVRTKYGDFALQGTRL